MNTAAFVSTSLLVLSPLADSRDIKWLKEWALFFALMGGMLVAVVWPL